ncbi:MAG: DUF84 family protein [Candidatus Heimdallarchaeota archaeon]|nr:DUF84 family protein [Candidatus Heimdallarchaeota archaeon]
MVFIAIGSKNPAKIRGVTAAAKSYWDEFEILSYDAMSGVSDMPSSRKEIREGAKNRALDTLNWLRQKEVNDHLSLAIGNEAGAAKIEGDWYIFSCSLITDGKIDSWCGETLFKLPRIMAKGIKEGDVELGQFADELLGTDNIKQKKGTIAVLTNNIVSREDLISFNIRIGFGPWVNNFDYT